MPGDTSRQDWPIAPEIKRRLLERLVNYCDPHHPTGKRTPARVVLPALQVLAALGHLTLVQQSLDLMVEKWAAKQVGQAELLKAIEAAERIVNDRRPPRG